MKHLSKTSNFESIQINQISQNSYNYTQNQQKIGQNQERLVQNQERLVQNQQNQISQNSYNYTQNQQKMGQNQEKLVQNQQNQKSQKTQKNQKMGQNSQNDGINQQNFAQIGQKSAKSDIFLSNKIPTKKSGKFDVPLLIVALALVLFGIIMVYSASMYIAKENYGNQFYFMNKQIIGAVLGFASIFALTLTDYHVLYKVRFYILGVAIILLFLVFVPGLGVEVYGAKRWINLPFFTLQPSEIAKFAYIIFCAGYMAKHHDKMTKFVGLLPVIGVGLVIAVLIIIEPNMSITMCVVLLMVAMLFIGGTKIKHFVMLLVPIALMVPVLIIMEPYRLKRLLAFLNPWESPLAEGYQLIQSFYSLGSGGLFGLGLFNSRQKYMFLPFAESDFIFSIIGEELGFVGCGIVILMYVILIARAINIAQRSSDLFGSYLAGGIASIIAIQVLINIAVVTGSIPPTGLPLPFISAGSTSLIVFCSSIGILQSISMHSHKSITMLSKH